MDRQNGIIYGVKVLGPSSPNRHGLQGVTSTEYTREAMEGACPLYEGKQVFKNHPPRSNPKQERNTDDLVGLLKNVTLESDGIYADLHYCPDTEDGKRLAWGAEAGGLTFGLSHNADGKGRTKSKKYLIEQIENVRSVDLVTRPATTKNLFESQEQAMEGKKTLRQLIESIKSERLVTLLEDDMGMPMDAPMDAPAEGGDWRQHLADMIVAIIQDTSIDQAEVKKKVNHALKMLDEMAPADTGTDADSAPPPAMESKERDELASLRKEKAVRVLCESQDFKASGPQMKALLALESEGDRKEFIADAKGSSKSKPAGTKSSSLRSLTESAEASRPLNAKDFVRNITD